MIVSSNSNPFLETSTHASLLLAPLYLSSPRLCSSCNHGNHTRTLPELEKILSNHIQRKPFNFPTTCLHLMLTHTQNHPVTDLPCFWVHPCNTAAVMAELIGPGSGEGPQQTALGRHGGSEKTSLEYLILWFGVVGSAVGLNVSREVLLSCV